MRDEQFEWDDAKAASNFKKHAVTFDTAREAFDEPHWVEVDDFDHDEQRFLRLCQYQGQVYASIYTERDERIRLISARRANRHERRRYDENQA